jgi:hypothetical protein
MSGEPSIGGATAMLAEFLAIERDGRALYDAAVAATSGGLREQLFDLGAETERRVQLLERALQQLGGEPAGTPEVLLLTPLAAATQDSRHLLEALLMFEIRDEVIGETLEAMARSAHDPHVARVLSDAALPIQSNEAWGAHDAPRHRERIAFVARAVRAQVRDAARLPDSG